MKKKSNIFRNLLWFSMVVVTCGVIVAGIITNITLRSIEKNLPATLLTELNDLSLILENLSEVVLAANNAKNSPETEKFNQLRETLEIVTTDITVVRESYVFDNLIQASAFHAIVAPAIVDLQIWLSEGVSGFDPESETTAMIAFSRIKPVYYKARTLNRESRRKAQAILANQQAEIDQFLVSANLLFGSMMAQE